MATTPIVGSTSTTTSSIPDDLAQKAIAAITLALRDLQNMKELFREDVETVTISGVDGTDYTGPTMLKILKLAQTSDISAMGPIGTMIEENRVKAEAAQTAAEAAQAAAESTVATVSASASAAASSETAAKTSETNAKDSQTLAAASERAAKASEVAAKASETAAAASLGTVAASATAAAASATAAKAAEQNASDGANEAYASAAAAKVSEDNAASSASDLAAAVVKAEAARDLASQYEDLALISRNEAEGFKNDAAASALAASQSAGMAAAAISQAQSANKFTNAISVGDAGDPDENVVDFVKTPTINGVPIVASTTSGESHFHTDLTCGTNDNLNDASWAGKTFMVQKPLVTGSASAPVSSNNAPAGMIYSFAVCTDFYAGWTPAGGAKGRQRVQMIYDQESFWVRGYHQESTSWTGWKRIATQLTTDVTGKDLNTLILTGHYAYTSAVNAPVIDASEASAIYFLDVFSTDNGDDVYQVMHSPKTNSRFDRYRISGTWSRWWNTTATFDVDTMAAGTDLNTVTNPGWWGVPLDTARNLPTGTAYPPAKTGQGILEVVGISNGGTIQRLHYVDDGDVYYRHRPASTGSTVAAWGAWKVEARWEESRVLGIVNGGTGGNTAAAARTSLGAAGTGANSFTGNQNIDGDVILAGSHAITAPGGMTLPGATGNAQIRVGMYSATGLDARYEIFVQNKADPTKRTNLLTMDVKDSNAPAANTTNGVNGEISISGKLTVSNTSVFNNTISTDGTPAGNYKMTMLNGGATAGGKSYLRKFRGAAPDTIWHETVQGEQYRLAAGSTDSQEVFIIDKNGQGNGGEIRFHGHQLRLVGSGGAGSQGLFLRNDGGNSYFLITDKDKFATPLATGVSPWNSLRPFAISMSTGLVSMQNGLNVAPFVQSSFTGPFGWNDQYNAGSSGTVAAPDSAMTRAPFFEEFSNSGGSEYHPLIKQRFHIGGTAAKNGVWSQGTLSPDASWNIHYIPAGKVTTTRTWRFSIDGSTGLPGALAIAGTLTGASTIAASGNITGGGLISNGGITSQSAITARTGNITASAGSVYAGSVKLTSDIKEKKNLVKMENALEKIEGITGYLWDWKQRGESSAGVIAQDVEKVQPGLVEEDEKTGLKNLNYSGVIGLLVNAVKELKADNADLRAQLEELKASK